MDIQTPLEASNPVRWRIVILFTTVMLQGSLHEEVLCTSHDCPIFYPVKNCCVVG
jgi:hypothetical protein